MKNSKTQNQKPKKEKFINIFGFGSLINLKSLSDTIGREVLSSEVTPISLKGYKQFWGMQARLSWADGDFETLFLNLIKDKTATAYGVVVKVNEDEFAKLIKREKGYEILKLKGYKEPLFAFGTTKKEKNSGFIPARYIKVIKEGLKNYNYPKSFTQNFKKAVLENLPFPTKDGSYNDFLKNKVNELFKSPIGIEKESIRVRENGDFSETSHHKNLGSPTNNPYIKMDFAENQLEFITPPCKSSDEILSYLKATHQITANLYKSELFWPFSSPAKIGRVKIAKFDDEEAINYRKYLVKKYGKEAQMMSGIHYNFSISSEISAHFSPRQKDAIYLKLARNYLKHRFILTYLYGSSPFISKNYPNSDKIKMPLKSIRQSSIGYRNLKEINISYLSVEKYKKSLSKAIKSGELINKKELYKDIRLKFDGDHISYLEFRNFDLNPFAPYGILKDDLDFIKLFIIAMLIIPEDDKMSEILGDELSLKVANSSAISPCIDEKKALEILDFMLEFSKNQLQNSTLEKVINEKKEMILDPKKTLSAMIVKKCGNLNGFNEFGLHLAKKYRDNYLTKEYSLHGFEELEISTQDVLKHAISRGISVEILDKVDNLFSLSFNGKTEIVKNANMSSKDSLISYFLMENKLATKKVLTKNGINTPKFLEFQDPKTAKNSFENLSFKSFVVKPKSTNYGLGISIFESFPSKNEYEDAINLAFKEDSGILVEEFFDGDEYRFYVQDDKVLAVCERFPARVIGDGKSTIAELIEKENQNPLRGTKYKTPLAKLEMNEIERLELSLQGYSFNYILEDGKTALLRRNSNVSTGGFSVDRTKKVAKFYKDIAVKTARALGARICGVDIILKEPLKPSKYAVIEANFNPAMLIHLFAKGEKQEVGLEFLKFLFKDEKF